MDNPICVITEERAYLEDGQPRCSVSTVLAFEGDDIGEIINGMIRHFVCEYYDGCGFSQEKILNIVSELQSAQSFKGEDFCANWRYQTFYV